MSLLRRLDVRLKLALLTATVLAAFAGSHLVQVRTLQAYRVGGPAHAELKQQTETYDTLQALLGELSAARAVLHLMLAPASEDRARQLRRQWEETAEGVEARFERALAVANAPDARLYVEDARRAWSHYARAVREQVLAAPPAERVRVVTDFLQGAAVRRHARLAELLEAAANSLRLRSSELEHEVERTLARTRGALLAAGVALALLLYLFLTLVGRSITRPLQALVAAARQVEGGDLSVQLASAAPDELGELSRILGQMVAHLRELLLAVRHAGMELAGAVERLAAAADEQSLSVNRQATAVTQTSALAQQIRQTSELAAQQAGEVLRAAQHADEVGRSGMEALAGSLQGIQDIHAQIDEISRRVLELAERSARVSAITDTVRDLAKQSDVLALNAAVEATRAGEKGVGFKVVASAIRGLADRSVRAALEVREQMELTGSAMRNTVAITEQGRARVQEGLAQVRTGGERLEELARLLQESGAGLRRISRAVEEQHRGVGEISTVTRELSRTTDEAVAAVGTMRASAEHLRAVTARLTESLSGFRL